MVISPDGKILKELNKSEGVITVSVDKKLPTKLRSIIPSLKSD
jgi:predicted amidohydrolase